MEIKRVDKKEYDTYVKNYTSIFESSDFNELNSSKCKEVYYLLFTDSKFRFGLIAGLTKDDILKTPFSAPYSMFTNIRQNNKVKEYDLAVKSLVEYAKTINAKEIYFTLPPKFYNETHISNLENAFFTNGFKIDKVDLNFHYCLDEFDKNYIQNCDIKARQKLNSAFKSNLSFEKAEDEERIKEAYEIIKSNRSAKGYPLHMSFEDVQKTIKLIKADFFIVRKEDTKGIASAMIFHLSKDIVQVIYWGHVEDFESLYPMNYLSYKAFEYYNHKGFKFFDIGPSTDNSIPNFGLCDFKQAIGCKTNSKYSFSLELE